MTTLYLFLAVLMSGSYMLFRTEHREISLLGFCILLLPWIFDKARFDSKVMRKTTAILLIVIVISAVQFICFGPAIIFSSLGFTLKVLLGGLVAALAVGLRSKFVNILLFFCAFSLVAYSVDVVFQVFGGDIRNYLQLFEQQIGVKERYDLLLHTFQPTADWYRNSGPFWEPAAFAGFIVLAGLLVVFDSDCARKCFVSPPKAYAILTAALLTTVSTTGYVLWAILTLYWLTLRARDNRQSFYAVSPIIAIIALISIVLFFNAEFLAGKITAQFELVAEMSSGWQHNRIGSAVFDYYSFIQHPWIGWAMSDSTQYSVFSDLQEHRLSNGLTGSFRQLGAFGGVGYLLVLVGFAWNIPDSEHPKTVRTVSVFIVLLLSATEYYQHVLLFWMILLSAKERRKDFESFNYYANSQC